MIYKRHVFLFQAYIHVPSTIYQRPTTRVTPTCMSCVLLDFYSFTSWLSVVRDVYPKLRYRDVTDMCKKVHQNYFIEKIVVLIGSLSVADPSYPAMIGIHLIRKKALATSSNEAVSTFSGYPVWLLRHLSKNPCNYNIINITLPENRNVKPIRYQRKQSKVQDT